MPALALLSAASCCCTCPHPSAPLPVVQVRDLMGYQPSPENKINIHVGGVYNTLGSKEDTMRRWAANYNRLSPGCRARMTGG